MGVNVGVKSAAILILPMSFGQILLQWYDYDKSKEKIAIGGVVMAYSSVADLTVDELRSLIKEVVTQTNTVRVGSEYQKRERKQRTTPQQSGSRAAKNEV